jgi:short-subunit dehydrogenase
MRVLVTGASEGIGRGIALGLAARGADLVLAGRRLDPLEKVAEECRRAGGRALGIAADVSVAGDRERLIAETLARLGGLDTLVNNAGRGHYGAVETIDADEFAATLLLNTIAPTDLTRRALPALRASKGVVAMISSVAGVVAAPGLGAYAASKFALEAVSASLRAELFTDGVAVVMVRPGPVQTEFRAHATRGVPRPARERRFEETVNAVAKASIRAILNRDPVLETSTYVRAASLLGRVAPGAFRIVGRRMAAPKHG